MSIMFVSISVGVIICLPAGGGEAGRGRRFDGDGRGYCTRRMSGRMKERIEREDRRKNEEAPRSKAGRTGRQGGRD